MAGRARAARGSARGRARVAAVLAALLAACAGPPWGDFESYEHWFRVAEAGRRGERGDLAGAIADYEDVLRRYPGNAATHAGLGAALLRAERYDEAAAQLSRALAADPDDHESAYLTGLALRRAGRDAEAVPFLEWVTDYERYADACVELAGVHERAGRPAAALREIDRALDSRPTPALERRGALLRARAGDFVGAVATLEAMLAEDPEDAETLYQLGQVHWEAGHEQEALVLLGRAIDRLERTTDGDAGTAEHLGDAYQLLGDGQRALVEYERALQLDPPPERRQELERKRDALWQEVQPAR